MLEDRLLIWKFKRGSRVALQQIYEKYSGYLLTLATALLNDVNSAEDIVHDFFVAFAQSGQTLKLAGSLKSYLATCVMNRARDKIRLNKHQAVHLDYPDLLCSKSGDSGSAAICNEYMQRLSTALEQIPYKQREAVILHIRGQMTFKAIAESQKVSIQTVQSRYRYGLDKLRVILDGEATE
jgi:RNA polymerase sigma factor (sigma-70 family)